jgi:hypothetical protein
MRDRRNESIPAPRHRLHVYRLRRGVAKRLPQIGNSLRQRVVADDDVWPDRGEQFFLGCERRRPLDEIAQEIDQPRRHRQINVVAHQPVRRDVEREWSEAIARHERHPILIRPWCVQPGR